MRTTVRLDEHLLAQAKQYALTSGKTLTSLIEEALRERLARGAQSERHKPVRLRVCDGTGVLPGVDLDDSSALLDVMES
ncbi:MAG: type II toxin-antitoxin system VapB family antitoxin [Burkholderiaceae bacterium]